MSPAPERKPKRKPKRKPERKPKRGTLDIDRYFPGLGRVKKASGTRDRATRKKLLSMIDLLIDKGRLDLVRGWVEGIYSLLELYAAYQDDSLDRLASPLTVPKLWRMEEGKEVGVIAKRLAKWKRSPTHLRSTKLTFARLRELAPVKDGEPTSRLQDLPALLGAYRDVCEANGHATSFNLARAHSSALAKDVAGKGSALQQAIQNTEPLPVQKVPRRPGDIQTVNEGRALELREFLRMYHALAAVGAAFASLWRTMLCTGMGPKEVYGPWETATPDGRAPRVRIDGTKRTSRARAVPYFAPFGPLEHPEIGIRQFSAVLRGVSGGQVQPYDARRTFSHLCSLAGVPRARKKVYMGHATKDVDDLYEAHQVETYLEADAAAILTYIEQTMARLAKAEPERRELVPR